VQILQQRGLALTSLSISGSYTGLYGRLIVKFVCSQFGERKTLPATKIGSGSIVGVTVTGPGPLIPQATGVVTEASGVIMSISCRVTLSGLSISVAFDVDAKEFDGDQDSFPDGKVILFELANDVTYKRMQRFLFLTLSCITTTVLWMPCVCQRMPSILF
jgi:hypothetical protein